MSNINNIAPQQGNLFENENIVVNPVAAAEQTGQAVEPPVELPVEQQPSDPPVYAVTKGNIGTARPATAAQIEQELNSPQLVSTREEIRAGQDEATQKALKEKHKFDIAGLCVYYSLFRGDHRAADDALPEYCTYDTCCDVDEREYGQQAVDAALRLNQEPGMFHDKLLYIEHSLRGGLDANGKATKVHIWWRLSIGTTAIETQQAFSQAAGVPVDPAMQQKQAFVYMTGDAIYRSPLWLVPITPEQRDAYATAFKLRGLSIDGWDKLDASTASKAAATEETPAAMPTDADIIEPTPRTDYIFDRHYKMTGLEPSAISTDGKCHNSLKSLLSTGIVALLTKAEMQGQLRKRTPDYWLCTDCQNLIRDFYSKYNDPARALTREQRQILANSERMDEDHTSRLTPLAPTSQPYCDELTLSEIYASPEAPRLNRKKTPRMVKAVNSRTPDENLECVSQTSFPSLMMHPKGLSAKYIDNRPRELRAGCVAVAETGIGKAASTCPSSIS